MKKDKARREPAALCPACHRVVVLQFATVCSLLCARDYYRLKEIPSFKNMICNEAMYATNAQGRCE